jgi:nitrate/nitrite transporter NarK
MAWVGWRLTFLILGVLGIGWCVIWLKWFRDDPATHPAVGPAELDHIQRGLTGHSSADFAWRQMLSPNLLLICLMYFTLGYTLYFNLTWLPIYLREARGFTVVQAGLISSIVLTMGAIGTWLGGWLTDSLVRRYGLQIGRSIGVVALPVSGALVTGAALVHQPWAAVALLALTLGVADLALSPSWSMCHDIGTARAGVVTGAMNTMGNIGGAVSPLVVGYAVQGWNSWTVPFFITAGIYVAGGLLTLMIDPRQPLWPPNRSR